MQTVPEVARHYGVRPETVVSWIDAGELAAVNVAPAGMARKHYRISESALADFEKSRGQPKKKPTRGRAHV